ncbi:hypothetical protein PV08_01914 [Exophiala spinifera]|uniref:Uncharacterized protein n=1 Tax=Exophiala spinifera TaxID=91928 RepID=A0A0D2CCV2_9EURO|nr:uncharacterized protein PV08_01914 [Exophiala spinifera]KIW21334.1 hypothetical protein PV08_01914 [Exophiala spinifera]
MASLDADDMYLSQLSRRTEAINAGVMAIRGHSHAVSTPDRNKNTSRLLSSRDPERILCYAMRHTGTVSSAGYSAAFVTHATASDVDSVMINGQWVKGKVRLLKEGWHSRKLKLHFGKEMAWDQSAKEQVRVEHMWLEKDVME